MGDGRAGKGEKRKEKKGEERRRKVPVPSQRALQARVKQKAA